MKDQSHRVPTKVFTGRGGVQNCDKLTTDLSVHKEQKPTSLRRFIIGHLIIASLVIILTVKTD